MGRKQKGGESEGRGRGGRETCMMEGEVTQSWPSSLTLVSPLIHSLMRYGLHSTGEETG